MEKASLQRAEHGYRNGLLAMRGGVIVALLAVLALPPGEGSLLLFLAACLAIAWGAWCRRRYCPVRRARGATPPTRR